MKKKVLMMILSFSIIFTSMPVSVSADDAFIGVDMEDTESVEAETDDADDTDEEYNDHSERQTAEMVFISDEDLEERNASANEDEPETEEKDNTETGTEDTTDAGTEENALQEYLREKGIVNGTYSDNTDYGNPDRTASYSYADENELPADRAASYPSKYDPRAYNKVSAVRTQVSGTCWLYSGIAAVESNLIHKGYTDNTIDLSELQTVYFLKYPHIDPLGYYSENTGSTKGNTLSEFMDGGTVARSLSILSTWAAPVYESDAPFYENETFDAERVDSWVLDESLTDKNYWHFKGSKSCNYDIEDMKYLITNYGGITASYYDYASYYRTVTEGGDASYYYPYYAQLSNHAIEIVGWDDNYSKDNFISKPAGNGAWLCKNSWGEIGDVIGVISNGYFWMSYYQGTILDITAIEMDSADTYENIYAHDGCKGVDVSGAKDRKFSMNVYTAKAYGEGSVEKIDGVMTYLGCNSEYAVTVYANPVIRDGKLVSWSGKSKTYTGASDYTGYYTIDMRSDPLYVVNGNKYAIYMETGDEHSTGVAYTNAPDGSCYIGNSPDSLIDCNTDNGTNIGYSSCLRGLTNKAENINLSANVTLSDTSLCLTDTSSVTLSATVAPANTTFKSVSFYSTDETVAVVDENGKVTPKGAGKCDIIVTAYDGMSSATCHVTVDASTFTLPDMVIPVGESISLAPVYEGGFEGAPADAYTWSVSDPSLASIDGKGNLTALKKGTVTVEAYLTANPSVKASCKVSLVRKAQGIRIDAAGNCWNMTEGESRELKATILPEDADNKAIKYEIDNFSGYEVLRSENGIITAVNSGDARIILTTTDGTNISATLSVTVHAPVISIMPGFPSEQSLTMNIGEEKTLGFWVKGGNPEEYCKLLSATSSDESVLAVKSATYVTCNGGNTACDIRALKAGTVTLTIKSNDSQGETLVYTITVKGNTNENNTGNNEGNKNITDKPSKVAVDGVTYKFNGDTLSIEKVSGNKSSYTLYSFITYQNKKYPVTVIGKNAFKNCTKMKKITIPSSVTTIESGAFQNCSMLKSITIPSKVTSIGKKAFYNCKVLKKVTIKGTKLKSVGSSAFKKIKKNATITVPKNKLSAYQKLLKGKYDSGAKVKK